MNELEQARVEKIINILDQTDIDKKHEGVDVDE